jgi:predicted nucleotidyltransferase
MEDNEIHRLYERYYRIFEPEMQRILELTIETVLKYLKENCLSIYLIGSYGRNEGAIYVDHSCIRPLRDFDILVVTNRTVSNKTIKKITDELHEKIGLVSPTNSPFVEFCIWITATTFSELTRCPPLLKFYELKVASRHLYGIDVRDLINLRFEDLSLYNGILILFTKVNGLLILYPSSLYSFNGIVNYVYEILKLYVETPTIFSLIDRTIYETTFEKRCLAFYDKFRVCLPSLFRLIPALGSYTISGSVRRKLLTKDYINSLDLKALSMNAINALDKLISIYIKIAYGVNIPTNGFTESNEKLIYKIGVITLTNFFSDYLRKVLRTKLNLLSRVLGLMLYFPYIFITNFNFVIKARREGLAVRLKLVFAPRNNFTYLTYAGIIMLKRLFNDSRKIHNECLKIFESYLQKTYVEKVKTCNESIRIIVMVRLLAKLLRLSDVSLHRKAF